LKLFINEVNSTGKWIEIYNDEDKDVDLGGFTVVRYNNDGGIDMAYIPKGTAIAAKGFVTLYQEGVVSPAKDAIECLPYGISSDRLKQVILKDNLNRIVDDTFDIGFPQTVVVSDGASWARKTDGHTTIVAIAPTPNQKNDLLTAVEIIQKEDIRAYIYAGTLYLPANTSFIQLYSTSGKLILSREMNSTSMTPTTLPQGVYIVRMTVSEIVYTQKIIIN
jgi:hypothetical protein